MRHILIISVIIILSSINAIGASLKFSDPAFVVSTPIQIEPEKSTGLEMIYVVTSFSADTKIEFEATGTAQPSTVKWQRFSNLGGGFAEDIPSSVDGRNSVITLDNIPDAIQSKGMGYIVEYEGRQHCFWVVNYSQNECTLTELAIMPEQECDRTAIAFIGSADRIVYYSVNGVAQTLSRDMEMTYNTLVYNEEQKQYTQQKKTENFEFVEDVIRVDAPLCDTEFTLSADRFQKQWNNSNAISITSPSFHTNAIAATTCAIQEEQVNDNEQKVEKAPYGGSGPATITFSAQVTDAVVFKEWQFSRDQQFELIDLRFQELDVTHTFDEYGSMYVRFTAGNDSGTCEFTGETYEVYIGESKIDCPNAFSPHGSEGVNDEWKVSYKSLIDFDCYIFNRWGQEMCHLTDPSQGWDGRYKGKLVPSGVYYYVIKATGTDGKKYKLSGDINILKSKDDKDGTN